MNKKKVKNWINGSEIAGVNNNWMDKFNPHDGQKMLELVLSSKEDIDKAVSAAKNSFSSWSEKTPVSRGDYLFNMVKIMKEDSNELAKNIAEETGKPLRDALGEVGGSVMQGEFFAGEGMRENFNIWDAWKNESDC